MEAAVVFALENYSVTVLNHPVILRLRTSGF